MSDDEDAKSGETPFATLIPDRLITAIESLGYQCDGRLLALNSYENRVYQIGLEDATPIIAKFYRAGRWSDATILEEHAFTQELAAQEIPVVAPLADTDGKTLHHVEDLRFALYPRCAGRSPELDAADVLPWLGRFLARIHLVGGVMPFQLRNTLNLQHFGISPSEFLLSHGFIPADLRPAYESVLRDLLAVIRDPLAGPMETLRLHGDCHPGNILWREQGAQAGPHFVDFDDCLTGPAVQDIWMLLSGTRAEMSAQLDQFMDGYLEFADFNPAELKLIEPLRSLRIIHYAGWLARRWHDPAFPMAFPWFNTQRYWQDHILTLREQLSALQEPPLSLTR